MAWSLVAIFSISSIASSGVFNLIFSLAESSRSCLEWGRGPSINMFSWIGSLNPWVGVIRSRPRKWSKASLNGSSGNWWNEEISTFPLGGFGFQEILLQKLLNHLLPSSQIVSLEWMKPSFCFTDQGKREQIKANGIFRNLCYLYCITYLYVSSQISIQIFIWQTMEEVSLNQVNEGMWIWSISRLNFRPCNTGEILWWWGARLVL